MFGGPLAGWLAGWLPGCLAAWLPACSLCQSGRAHGERSPHREVMAHTMEQHIHSRNERMRVEQADIQKDQHTAKRSPDAFPPSAKRQRPPLAPLQGQTEPAAAAATTSGGTALAPQEAAATLPPPKPLQVEPPVEPPVQPGAAVAPQAEAMLPPKPRPVQPPVESPVQPGAAVAPQAKPELPASSASMAAAESEALASLQGQAAEVDASMPASSAPMAAAKSEEVDGPAPAAAASSAPMEAAQSEALASLQGQADQREDPDSDPDTDTEGEDEAKAVGIPDTEDEARAGAHGGAQTGVWRQQIPTFWLVWAHVGPLRPVWVRLGPCGPKRACLGVVLGRFGPVWARASHAPFRPVWARLGAFGPTPPFAHPCWRPLVRRRRPRAIRTRRPMLAEVPGDRGCLPALLSSAPATSSSSAATGAWTPRSLGSCRIGRPSATSGTSTQRRSWTRRRRPLLIWKGAKEGTTGRVGVASTFLIGATGSDTPEPGTVISAV